ncbi:RNA recognition motif domain [Dillenia turbinata]|uniref:RNA recognition motif domain n=1 Tax=Dillenia turbinata TaxID=194707 RepID=A0AAN8V229_9MAGN
MSYSKRSRCSRSPSPYNRYGRSVSRSLSRSRSRSRSRSHELSDAENPGNNLYVTGLSPRITKRELEKHFSSEGKVVDVHLVVDPWTRESRGFGFVTMSSVDEAHRCIKYLDRSVLEGRVITVEKAKRRRGRTPTPGRYLGLRTIRERRRTPSYSPYRRSYSRSPRYSSDHSRSPSYSPRHTRRRSYTPYDDRRRSYSPYYSRRRSPSRSRSPYGRSQVRRLDRSYSLYDYSPDDRYYRSISRSRSPRGRSYHSRRTYSPSVSPSPRRSSRRRRYSVSYSPRRSSRRSYSRSLSPEVRRASRSVSRDASSRSYSRSRSASPSRSLSKSPTPKSSSGRR